MRCLKCGAEATSNLSSTWCDSCVQGRKRNRLLGFVAFWGIFALIMFGVIHACSRLFTPDSNAVVSINENASVTDDIWCMESKEALDKLVELGAKNAYDEMNELFLTSGVTTLRKGQSVKVIDEDFSGYRVRTSESQECWVTSNMLTKENDSSPEGSNQPSTPTQAPKQNLAAEKPYEPAPGEEIIGQWQDAPEAGGWAYAIVRSKGKFFMDVTIPPDNSPTRDDLTVTDSTNGRKYLSDNGDTFVIARDGSLRVYDQQGYIETARKVRK
jgi:hypothetical protein